MAELTFVRREDAVLIVKDGDGNEYALPLTSELRDAVRFEPRSADSPAEELRPREIQAMLRAGASAREVAELGGLDMERVERYESPVIAERNWVIQQAQQQPVGHQLDSPVLGDLVVDRLATREVDVEALEWDARRDGNAPWQVRVHFELSGRPAEATWEYDLTSHSLRALDDEARWLSETDTSSPRSRHHLADVVTAMSVESLPRVEEAASEEKELADSPTTSLLDDLSAMRGQRPPAYDPAEDPDLLDELDVEEPETDAKVISLAARKASAESPVEAGESAEDEDSDDDDDALDAEDSADVEAEAAPERKPKSRSGRRPVPSWDEIVFGSKSD